MYLKAWIRKQKDLQNQCSRVSKSPNISGWAFCAPEISLPPGLPRPSKRRGIRQLKKKEKKSKPYPFSCPQSHMAPPVHPHALQSRDREVATPQASTNAAAFPHAGPPPLHYALPHAAPCAPSRTLLPRRPVGTVPDAAPTGPPPPPWHRPTPSSEQFDTVRGKIYGWFIAVREINADRKINFPWWLCDDREIKHRQGKHNFFMVCQPME